MGHDRWVADAGGIEEFGLKQERAFQRNLPDLGIKPILKVCARMIPTLASGAS